MNGQLLTALALVLLAYVLVLLFRGTAGQRVGLVAAVLLGLMLPRLLTLLASAGSSITSVFTAGGQ